MATTAGASMSEQVSSDFLTRTKVDAQKRQRGGYICELDPNEVLALVECAEALLTVEAIAAEAHTAWDADNDMRVGKILIALAGRAPRYRADIDRIHAATTALEAL